MNCFREASRETKRLESISRSPVFAQFSETLGGLGTIRAYNQVSRFIYKFEHKVDLNTRTTYNIRTAEGWLSIRSWTCRSICLYCRDFRHNIFCLQFYELCCRSWTIFDICDQNYGFIKFAHKLLCRFKGLYECNRKNSILY